MRSENMKKSQATKVQEVIIDCWVKLRLSVIGQLLMKVGQGAARGCHCYFVGYRKPAAARLDVYLDNSVDVNTS